MAYQHYQELSSDSNPTQEGGSGPQQGPSDPWHSFYVRCPREPCPASYRIRNAERHAATCKHFLCPHSRCFARGTQAQMRLHQAICSLASSIVSSDHNQQSDSESEVHDILTSPDHRPSNLTEPSSDCSLHSSPPDSTRGRPKFKPDRLVAQPANPVPPSNDTAPQQSSVPSLRSPRLRRVPARRSLLVSPASTSALLRRSPRLNRVPTKRSSLTGPTSTKAVSRRAGQKRPTLDPYDPSSSRIFSRSQDSINPSLQPAPRPSRRSTPAPSPPARRVNTYELQSFLPTGFSKPPNAAVVPSGSGPASSATPAELQAELAYKTAQFEALQGCFRSAISQIGDVIYMVHRWSKDANLLHTADAFPMHAYKRVLDQLERNDVPDVPVKQSILAPVDEDEERVWDGDLDGSGGASPGERAESLQAESLYSAAMTQRVGSPEEVGLLEEAGLAGIDAEILSTDALSDAVRRKIADTERRAPQLMDSPRNLFGRKRKRSQRKAAGLSSPRLSPQADRPTVFIQKLADTTWDPSDELVCDGLPLRCNFGKVMEEAHSKMELRVRKRNELLSKK